MRTLTLSLMVLLGAGALASGCQSTSVAQYKQDPVSLAGPERAPQDDKQLYLELITQMQQILIDDAATIIHGYYNSRMISWADRVTGAEIATIACYEGFNTRGGAEGVGRSTIQAVVKSSMVVLISDYFLTYLLQMVNL